MMFFGGQNTWLQRYRNPPHQLKLRCDNDYSCLLASQRKNLFELAARSRNCGAHGATLKGPCSASNEGDDEASEASGSSDEKEEDPKRKKKLKKKKPQPDGDTDNSETGSPQSAQPTKKGKKKKNLEAKRVFKALDRARKAGRKCWPEGWGPGGRLPYPVKFGSAMCRHLFGKLQAAFSLPPLPPTSEQARTMVRALGGQGLLSPYPRGSPRPNGSVFPIPKSAKKCSLIVNLIPVNRKSPRKPDSSTLPTGEVLALLAMAAVQGSGFSYLRRRPGLGCTGKFGLCWLCLRRGERAWRIRGCLCATSTSTSVFGRSNSPRISGGRFGSLMRMGGLAFCCLPFGRNLSPILDQ